MNSIYRERREKLLKDKKTPYFAVFYGVNNPDLPLPFDRNFYYFTGLKNVTQVLVIKKDENGIHDKLYIETYNDRFVKFNGGFFSIEDARNTTGIEDVVFNENFEEEFVEELKKYDDVTVGLDIVEKEGVVAANEELLAALMDNGIKTESLWYEIAALRLVKSEMEIENFRIANRDTLHALKAMMRAAHPGVFEKELEYEFYLDLAKQHVTEKAFDMACAGGARATTLHYHNNNQIVNDGEMVLVDLGSAKDYYGADISRTFPVNGKFTKRQKEVYDVVLGAQNLALKMARPGISVLELNDYVVKYYEQELPKIGLCTDGVHTVKDYYYHSVSHSIGLECHDIHDRNSKMVPGMIISNEPGLYIAEEGIGIRLEDDLLITEDGAINLSADFPHTTEEVEEIMKH